MPPVALDAAIIFAPVGALVPQAPRALAFPLATRPRRPVSGAAKWLPALMLRHWQDRGG